MLGFGFATVACVFLIGINRLTIFLFVLTIGGLLTTVRGILMGPS